jgi:hypothetical protein
MTLLMNTLSLGLALVVHAVAAPLIFIAIAGLYFRNRGAREPLATAVTWTSIVAALDAVVVAALIQSSFAMFESIAGTWLPPLLILLAVWGTGVVMSMKPMPQRAAV